MGNTSVTVLIVLATLLSACNAIYPAQELSTMSGETSGFGDEETYTEKYVEEQPYKEEEEDEYYYKFGRETLDSKGRYTLEWRADYKTKTIQFNIICRTTGWVGLGLSKDGKMKEADLIVAGARKGGGSYIQDMHADYNRKVRVDNKQDWVLISAAEYEYVTYINVTRPWDTCDPYDYPVTLDLVWVLWAFGPTDVYNYHFDKRGAFRVYLLDPIPKRYEPVDLWQVRTEITMPDRETSYFCTVHRAPILTHKHHIVEAAVYLENDIAVQHVHHMLLWRCVAPPGFGTDIIFEPLTLYPGEECYFNRAHVIPHLLCKFLILGWAIGGKPDSLPYSVGIPLGEEPAEYYLLETHYNNPLHYSGVKITSGIDVYYTDKLRRHDGGAMIIASYDIFGLFMVPPVSTNFEVYGYCSPNCTRTMFPDSGIEIVSGFLHAHISGRKLELKLFRKGIELEPIFRDYNFDSTFQQPRHLYEPRLVLPGDLLVMSCEYDNTWTNITTVSGFSTREEMCLAGVLMKTRIPYAVCTSQVPQYTLLPLIGVEHVEWDVETQKRVITEPAHYAGKPLSYVTDEITDWDESLRYRIQDVTLKSTHIGMCPKVLAPWGVDETQTNATSIDSLSGILSTVEENVDVLQMATAYGVETLMGTITVPTRTPGPISHISYPFLGRRYPERTCPRVASPFSYYYKPRN